MSGPPSIALRSKQAQYHGLLERQSSGSSSRAAGINQRNNQRFTFELCVLSTVVEEGLPSLCHFWFGAPCSDCLCARRIPRAMQSLWRQFEPRATTSLWSRRTPRRHQCPLWTWKPFSVLVCRLLFLLCVLWCWRLTDGVALTGKAHM